MGPIWGRQDPGGPHVGPMTFAIWVVAFSGKNLLPILLRLLYVEDIHNHILMQKFNLDMDIEHIGPLLNSRCDYYM